MYKNYHLITTANSGAQRIYRAEASANRGSGSETDKTSIYVNITNIFCIAGRKCGRECVNVEKARA